MLIASLTILILITGLKQNICKPSVWRVVHVFTTSQLSENHDSRKWAFAISDYVPYVYVSTIQDSLQCTVCEEYVDSSDKDIHAGH